jgi:hypothetical protein
LLPTIACDLCGLSIKIAEGMRTMQRPHRVGVTSYRRRNPLLDSGSGCVWPVWLTIVPTAHGRCDGAQKRDRADESANARMPSRVKVNHR